jgi:hypothetical protein
MPRLALEVRRRSPDLAEGRTEGLLTVTATRKRAENASALEETFGQRVWLGQETGHNRGVNLFHRLADCL